jgi:hypothetical protein
MEFKVGSLANLISGSKSPATATKSELFQNVGEGREVSIKFQSEHKLKKTATSAESKLFQDVHEGTETSIKFQAAYTSKKEKCKRKATEDDFSVRRKKR